MIAVLHTNSPESMTLNSNHIRSRILILAVTILVLAVLACGSDPVAPTAIPSGPGTGPQTTDEAIEAVRTFLAEKEFEGENCLAALESAVSAQWSATAPDDEKYSVTVRVDPPKLLHNVHTWTVDKRAGRVQSFRPTC
jgi:hypothetical protein